MKQEYLTKARQFAEMLQSRGAVSSEALDEAGVGIRGEAVSAIEPTPTVEAVQPAPAGSVTGRVTGRVSVYTTTPWPTRAEIEEAVEEWRAMQASSILAGMSE